MTRAVLFLLFTTLMTLAQPAAAQPKDPTFLIEKQVGQATGHTCQSYVLAIALAFKRDRNLPLRSWRDVRELEQRLRAEVVKARDARQLDVPPNKRLASPSDSARAVETVTNGVYTVSYKAYDEADFVKLVGARTGVTSAVSLEPSFLIGGLVRDVVISSAKKIGNTAYNSGHQFAIFGVSGSQNASSPDRQYLVLNSAAYKKPGEQAFNTCQDGLPDDPGPYFPSLSWRNDITWNPDGGKIRALVIEKK